MKRFFSIVHTGICTVLLAALARAQQAPLIPIRQLGQITTTSKVLLPSIVSIRALRDGRVLANDKVGHRVVLFDSSLAHLTTVADTTSGTQKAYGADGGTLFSYYGDSSLFGDVASLSLLVIDPAGKIVRIIAAPQQHATSPRFAVQYMIRPEIEAVFDGRGNILFKPLGSIHGGVASSPQAFTAVPQQDSSVILRANIVTKEIDTVARLLAANRVKTIASTLPTGGVLWTTYKNPMPVADAWTTMPDGTIAAIRDFDYHIDWYAPNGAMTSSPRIAHEWEHITDSMKVAILDSAKRADSLIAIRNQAVMAAQARSGIAGGDAGSARGGGAGGRAGTGLADGGMGGGAGTGATNDNAGTITVSDDPQYIDANDLPDYLPPFIATLPGMVNIARADADGNVWIRTNPVRPLPGGPVYDVVNREGKLVDRVQIPGATTLIGFGPGVAYLTSRVGTGSQLARARIH